jgi:hypothetical protein
VTHRIIRLGTSETPRFFTFCAGSLIVDDAGHVIGLMIADVFAYRAAELLDRYGLCDVPDNASGAMP